MGWWTQETDKPKPKPSAGISAPQNPSIGLTTAFAGQIKNRPQGYAVWAITRSVETGLYYPKRKACLVEKDQWDCGPSVRIGANGDHKKAFDLYVALVDTEGAIAIQNYFSGVTYQGHKEGLDALPEGVTMLHKVRVVRD
ncbi:hypothetical protein [Streptomyces sp. NPDC054829]